LKGPGGRDGKPPGVALVRLRGVIDEPVTTADLLGAWREATRAAELADRLATLALDAVEHADRNAAESREIAEMAERAAEASQHAAETARAAAARTSALAVATRESRLREAETDPSEARKAADRVGERYRAEQDARGRHDRDGVGPE
jgi:hypothetical protein